MRTNKAPRTPSLLLMMPPEKARPLRDALWALDQGLAVEIWPEVADVKAVSFCVAWKHPHGALNGFSNLQAISSYGAGVDHLLADPHLPEVSLCRVVDQRLSEDMAEFVSGLLLHRHCGLDHYGRAQRRGRWEPKAKLNTAKTLVGVMGMGQIGSPVAQRIQQAGFQVRAWSRRQSQVPGIIGFAEGEQDDFLKDLDYLVCLLPLSPQTRGILKADLFKKMKRGAYLINVARGDHLVEADLIWALDEGVLSGAALDVFSQEPLPPAHPFWKREEILITPHVASVTQADSVARQILENFLRVQKALPLNNQVHRERGY